MRSHNTNEVMASSRRSGQVLATLPYVAGIALLLVTGALGLVIRSGISAAETAAPNLRFVSVVKEGVDGVEGLNDPRQVLASPDGRHVYVGAVSGRAITAFDREPISGELSFIAAYRDGQNAIGGLNGVYAMAISPDGNNLYASDSSSNVVAIQRNATNGTLTLLNAYSVETPSLGTAAAQDLAVSPDGNYVYAAVREPEGVGSIAVFARSAVDGSLVLAQTLVHGTDGVELQWPFEIITSPDGNSVYTSGQFETIAVFHRAEPLGNLAFVEAHKATDGNLGLGFGIAVSPDGQYVYQDGLGQDAEDNNFVGLAVYQRNLSTGSLTRLSITSDEENLVLGPGSLAISPDGEQLYRLSWIEHTVAAYACNGATGALTLLEHYKHGNGVEDLLGPIAISLSSDGRHVYVASTASDSVTVFWRNPPAPVLTFSDAAVDGINGVNGLAGPFAVIVSDDGKHVYAAANDADSIAVFDRSVSTGVLTFNESYEDDVAGIDGIDGVRALVLSPDGRFLYAGGYFDDAVAVFERDLDTGLLTFVESHMDGTDDVDGLNGIWSLSMSPDGNHIHAAGSLDNAVAVFARNSATGALSFVESKADGVGGVHGITGVRAVITSPDGKYVYAAGYNESSIAVFVRNETTGALTFVGFHVEGTLGIEGLTGVTAFAMSSDGLHLYVASFFDDAVAVFSRNAGSGALSFVEVHEDGLQGVHGLNQASAVTLGANGTHIYAGGTGDNAITVFTRDASTGSLTFDEMHRDGQPDVNGDETVEGLFRVRSIAASADDRNVYAAGYSDHALSIFKGPDTTFIPEPTPTASPVPTATSAPSATPTPVPTATASPTPTPMAAPTATPDVPLPSVTPAPTATESPTATPVTAPTATPVAAPVSTATPTMAPTPAASASTVTPTPTASPTGQLEPTLSADNGESGPGGGGPAGWVWVLIAVVVIAGGAGLVGVGYATFNRSGRAG